MNNSISDSKWHAIFIAAIEILGEGEPVMDKSPSWCSWTTFDRLKCRDCGYWKNGLPRLSDVTEHGIFDGGVWGQPFEYDSIAHIIFPKEFCTDMGVVRTQNIQALETKFKEMDIPFQSNEYLLEIKLY